jgi:glycerol kinase
MNTETTAWGAAALAGLQVGVFESLDHLRRLWRSDAHFTAQNADSVDRDYALWQRAVRRVMT